LPPASNTHRSLQSCTLTWLCYNVRVMVTKRQLGIMVIVCGLLGVLGPAVVDVLGAGQWSGFGPLQLLVTGLAVVAIAVGGILVCLGDRPA